MILWRFVSVCSQIFMRHIHYTDGVFFSELLSLVFSIKYFILRYTYARWGPLRNLFWCFIFCPYFIFMNYTLIYFSSGSLIPFWIWFLCVAILLWVCSLIFFHKICTATIGLSTLTSDIDCSYMLLSVVETCTYLQVAVSRSSSQEDFSFSPD